MTENTNTEASFQRLDVPAEAPAPAPQVVEPAGQTGGYLAPGGEVRPSIRDRIAKTAPYTYKLVSVEEWDNVIVEIRSLNLGERNAMLSKIHEAGGEGADITTIYPEMVLRCSFDPASGDKVFTDDDLAFINSRPANLVDKLAIPAMELSGMRDTEKVVDEAAKKSSETEPESE